MRRLEEDVNVNNYMVNEKLPTDLSALEVQVTALNRISQMPAMGQDDIDQFNVKVRNQLNALHFSTPPSWISLLSYIRSLLHVLFYEYCL